MKMLTHRFDQALVYTSEAHRAQFRKGGSVPYISHLMGVASIALEFGANEDQAIAALLHDVVEDQGGLPRLEDVRINFGHEVANIVADCTDSHQQPKPPWKERKVKYIDSLRQKPRESLLVSLADKTHNAETIVADFNIVGDKIWDRFTGKQSGTLWYYKSLSEIFDDLFPAHSGRLRISTNLMDRANSR